MWIRDRERHLHPPGTAGYARKVVAFRFDDSVGPPHRNSPGVRGAHHHAFDNGLATNAGARRATQLGLLVGGFALLSSRHTGVNSGLRIALAETFDPTAGIDQALFPCVEGMALITELDVELLRGRPSGERVSTRTCDGAFGVFGMDVG